MSTLPNTIENGDIPDANILTENLQFLADGKGLYIGTYADCKTQAESAATVQFIAWATDLKQLVIYTGDTAEGDAGFRVIG